MWEEVAAEAGKKLPAGELSFEEVLEELGRVGTAEQ